MSFEYWYVFPYAICVATLCNASGFSGAVLFQPFFYFVLNLPISNSIATGIATETLGMTSGTIRYALMKRHDYKSYLFFLPWIIAGVVIGLFLFNKLPTSNIKFLVGMVMILVAVTHLFSLKFKAKDQTPWSVWVLGPLSILAGAFSASTGTGVAELAQPMSEHGKKMPVKQANTNAIMLEASADWIITAVNLSMGNIRWDILIFSASGVIIGGQLGAYLSSYIPDQLLKIGFCIAIAFIGCFYVWTVLK